MVEPRKNARNIAIILLLTVAVWQLPGGGTATRVTYNILGILLWGGLLFFAYRMYMERRTTLLDLPERQRLLLYGSVALATITLVGTSRMWDAGGLGVLFWFALMFAAGYGVYTVFRLQREY